MFHINPSAPPLPAPPPLPSLPPLPSSSSTPPLPPPLPLWPVHSLSASDIADGLYALHSSRATDASAARAQLQQLHRLSVALFSLVDPLHSDPSHPASPPSPSTTHHLHSSLTYLDPHQCDEQSIIELLPLLTQLTDTLSTTPAPSALAPPPFPPLPDLSSAEPHLLPSPSPSSSSSLLSTFLTLHWPSCCLLTIARVSLSLPFSPSQLRLLQSRLQLSVLAQLQAQSQAASSSAAAMGAAKRWPLPSLASSTTVAYDWLPLVQSVFHLTIRFAHIDPSPPSTSTDGDDGDPLQCSSASVSWLSLLHCLLLAHRVDLLSNTHYLLDTRMQHSPAFCSYVHRTFLHLLSALPSSPSFTPDHHHLSLLLLLASDDDYQAKAFYLLTLATLNSLLPPPTPNTTNPTSTLPTPHSPDDAPISFFSPTFDASHPAVQLWSSLLSLPYLEQKASLILRFALHLLEAPSTSHPVLSLAFHVVLLLFTSIPATRPSIVESIRSALFFDPLHPPHRRLFASLLAFLVLSSPPSHLSSLREPIKLCLSCLILAPLPLALSTLLALLPCFLPSSALSLDDLFPFLHKWGRALRVDHLLLTLTSSLWLLGRWSGWEEEEKGLLRLLEDGWKRLNEEGRGWLLTQLTAIVEHRSHSSPAPVHLPPLPLSLSASTEAVPLASLLSAVSFGLSPAALSSLLSLLHRHVALYVQEREAGSRRSKWAIPVARLHLPACFRLEWSASRAGDEDEDELYARLRREEKQRKRRKRGLQAQPPAHHPQVEVVALRDPLPLLLHCAWSALTADVATSSSSSPTSPPLLALLSAVARQLLDTSCFLPLLHSQLQQISEDAKEAEAPVSSLSSATAASVHCVSESLISPHQRWALLQSLCVVLARVSWDDSRQWRSDGQRQRKAMEAATSQRLSSLQALKSSKATISEALPLSSFKFVSAPPTPPIAEDSPDKDRHLPFCSFALLTGLSSSLPPSLSSSPDCHLFLLEQAAFLGLLMDFSPANTSPVSSSLLPSLLLPCSFLFSVLHDYVDSLTRLAVVPSLHEWPQKRTPSLSPSLSLVSVTFAVNSLLQVALPTSSAFPSVPAASLLPSFTPCGSPTASAADERSAFSACFSCIFNVFCASLGLQASALRVEAIAASAAFFCSPPPSIGKAVFTSARHLSSLFEAAGSTPLASSASPAWSRATAVYEQAEQYAEEVWNLRTQALLAMAQLIQRCPAALSPSLPCCPAMPASTVLALLLVHLFLYELDHQLTVPLAHAYIDCVHALHALEPTASPSASLRLTLALLPSLQPSSTLLCTDYRLARKVYRHVFTSMACGAEERRRAVQLMKDLLDGLWKDEKERKKDSADKAGAETAAEGTWTKRLRGARSRGRRRGADDGEEAEEVGGGGGSDDSEFDDARERRHARFLSRFSRSALLELDRQKEEDRRDRQEMKEKRVRKELLLSIIRYATGQLKTMRKTQWKGVQSKLTSGHGAAAQQLCSHIHDEAVFVSHVLCVLDFLCSSSRLEFLLDYSFAASSPSSDSPSTRLHSPLASLLHDCFLHAAHLLHQATTLVSDAVEGETQPELTSRLSALFLSDPPARPPDVVRGASTSALVPPPHLTSTSPPSPLTCLHLTRQLAANIAPASTLQAFLSSSPQLPATKAVDAKMAIRRARDAALHLLDALHEDLRHSTLQLPAEAELVSHSKVPRRGRQRPTAKVSTSAAIALDLQQKEDAEGRAEPCEPPQRAEPRLVLWLEWVSALRAESCVDGGHGGGDGGARPDAGRVQQVVRRRRGAAVLHSRNRYVDALLQEERETKDSFMDLEDFLV